MRRILLGIIAISILGFTSMAVFAVDITLIQLDREIALQEAAANADMADSWSYSLDPKAKEYQQRYQQRFENAMQRVRQYDIEIAKWEQANGGKPTTQTIKERRATQKYFDQKEYIEKIRAQGANETIEPLLAEREKSSMEQFAKTNEEITRRKPSRTASEPTVGMGNAETEAGKISTRRGNIIDPNQRLFSEDAKEIATLPKKPTFAEIEKELIEKIGQAKKIGQGAGIREAEKALRMHREMNTPMTTERAVKLHAETRLTSELDLQSKIRNELNNANQRSLGIQPRYATGDGIPGNGRNGISGGWEEPKTPPAMREKFPPYKSQVGLTKAQGYANKLGAWGVVLDLGLSLVFGEPYSYQQALANVRRYEKILADTDNKSSLEELKEAREQLPIWTQRLQKMIDRDNKIIQEMESKMTPSQYEKWLADQIFIQQNGT